MRGWSYTSDIHRHAGYIFLGQQSPGKENFQAQRYPILIYIYINILSGFEGVIYLALPKLNIKSICLGIKFDLHGLIIP